MTPFYFGGRQERLFGIYEPAAIARTTSRAAVLCHPWGDEYLHAHRAMRQLAIKLSRAGFHTLRFDFFGTGDSAGEMADADLARWEADIQLALEELRDMVGATRLTLIGLRLGATLAARVATVRPNDIDSVALWDPILSGPRYLASLGAAAAPAASSPPRSIRGFPLTPKMHRDLRAIDLKPPFTSAGTRTLTLVTDPGAGPAGPPDPWRGTCDQTHAVEFLTDVRPWIEDLDDAGAIPVSVIQRILDWLR